MTSYHDIASYSVALYSPLQGWPNQGRRCSSDDRKIVVDLNHREVEAVLESAQQVVQLVVNKGVRALHYG